MTPFEVATRLADLLAQATLEGIDIVPYERNLYSIEGNPITKDATVYWSPKFHIWEAEEDVQ